MLYDVFCLSEQRKDTMVFGFKVQMLEIYNEQVCNLLAEDSSVMKYPFHKPMGGPLFLGYLASGT